MCNIYTGFSQATLVLSPENAPRFSRDPPPQSELSLSLLSRAACETAVVSPWMNSLADKAHDSGKKLLLLNLIETSIPVSFTHTGGNVMLLDPTKKCHRPPR